MQRLTLAGRLLITAAILALLWFGFKALGGPDWLRRQQARTEQTDAGINRRAGDDDNAPATDTYNGDDTEATDTRTTSENTGSAGSSSSAFNYTPPAVTSGKLKGVVELGASGFNSFIIRQNDRKQWQLEKSEFGNSLVIENMATDEDVRAGLKAYIGKMLDFGVNGRDIHFVVSSGAAKADITQKLVKGLRSLNYQVNTVTPEQEGRYALLSVLPQEFSETAFVTDIGSGNTKVSWKQNGVIKTFESYGSKYFQNGISDQTVATEVASKARQIPAGHRERCFIIGGVPFSLAKQVRNGKERFTVLPLGHSYDLSDAKSKAGMNILRALSESTGCRQFVFDWDANFTIGFLLDQTR